MPGTSGDLAGVVYECGNGRKRLDADYVISSMPISQLLHTLSGYGVPDEVQAIGDKLPYRDFMTAGLLVDRLEIDNQTHHKTLGNIVPDCWIYIQEPDVKLGRLQVFNNWSPYLVESPESKVWLGLEYFCQQEDEMWQMQDEDFLAFAVRELENIGIIRHNCVEKGCVVRMLKLK